MVIVLSCEKPGVAAIRLRSLAPDYNDSAIPALTSFRLFRDLRSHAVKAKPFALLRAKNGGRVVAALQPAPSPPLSGLDGNPSSLARA
jgi:hypothetical protein